MVEIDGIEQGRGSLSLNSTRMWMQDKNNICLEGYQLLMSKSNIPWNWLHHSRMVDKNKDLNTTEIFIMVGKTDGLLQGSVYTTYWVPVGYIILIPTHLSCETNIITHISKQLLREIIYPVTQLLSSRNKIWTQVFQKVGGYTFLKIKLFRVSTLLYHGI